MWRENKIFFRIAKCWIWLELLMKQNLSDLVIISDRFTINLNNILLNPSAMIPEKTPKIIDKKFAVDMNHRLGGGSYGDVYTAIKLDDPHTKLACKILSKQKILRKIEQSNCEDKEAAINYIIKSTKN